MNILHTAHSKAQRADGVKGKNSLMDAVGKNAKVNSTPNQIQQLKQDPKYKDVNFDHVLRAADKGHDPKAMAELLKKEHGASSKTPASENQIPFVNEQAQEKSALFKNKMDKPVPAKPMGSKSILAPMKQREQVAMAQDGYTNPAKNQPQLSPLQQQLKNQLQPLERGQVRKIALTAEPAPAQQAVGNYQKQASAKRTSIFATPRVLEMQSTSKYAADKPAPVPPKVAAERMSQTQQVLRTQAPQVQAQKVMTAPVVSNGQQIVGLHNTQTAKPKPLASAYQTNKNSMIQMKSPQQAMVINTDEKFNTSDMNMGSESQMSQSQFDPAMAMNKTPTMNIETGGKVLNLNQVQLSGNIDTVINQIQDYVVQTQAANNSEVAVTFEHQDLGQVDLMVQKQSPNSDQLNIQIATRGNEAAEFFKTHQGELINTLNRSGIQVADLKLDASQNLQQELSQESSKQGFEGRGQRQHQSQSGQRDADSQRREQLWNQFYENKEAA